MDLAPVHLRGIAVTELVDAADPGQDDPELDEVPEWLLQERVKLDRLGPDRVEARREDRDREKERDAGDSDDGGAPEPADVPERLGEDPVGVENLEEHEEDVETLGALLGRLLPQGLELREQLQILLGRRLLQELDLVQHLLEIEDEGEGDIAPLEPSAVLLEDLGWGPGSVEKLDERPVAVFKVVELVRLWLLDDPGHLADSHLAADDEVRPKGGAVLPWGVTGGESRCAAPAAGGRDIPRGRSRRGCAHGRRGQSRTQNQRAGFRRRARRRRWVPVETLAFPSMPGRSSPSAFSTRASAMTKRSSPSSRTAAPRWTTVPWNVVAG